MKTIKMLLIATVVMTASFAYAQNAPAPKAKTATTPAANKPGKKAPKKKKPAGTKPMPAADKKTPVNGK